MKLGPAVTTQELRAVPVRPVALDEDEALRRNLTAAIPAATRRAYVADWASFTRWCGERGVPALPADPQDVARYLSWLYERPESPCAPSTVARHLAGIGHAHEQAGHPRPSVHPGVRLTVRGIRQRATQAGRRRRRARALRPTDIRHLVEDLDPGSLAGLRDRALVLVGFAGALRASELVGLDLPDLAFEDRGLRAFIARSKTDQSAAGRTIGIARGGRTSTDPVLAVRAWLDAAGLTDGPVFRSVSKGRTPRLGTGRMATSSVRRILDRAALRAGVDRDQLSPHSLRRGHITAAAEAGVEERRIAATSGHRSLVVLRGYIEEATALDDPSSAHLGL